MLLRATDADQNVLRQLSARLRWAPPRHVDSNNPWQVSGTKHTKPAGWTVVSFTPIATFLHRFSTEIVIRLDLAQLGLT